MPDWAAAVVGLHDFFTQWFAGEVPDEPEAFQPVASALAPRFTIVSPSGREMDRDATIAMVHAARGTGAGGPRISIGRCEVVMTHGPLAVVRYVEIQDFDDGRHTERISTALLESDVGAPDGVRWHSVHETWLPPAESPPRMDDQRS